MAFAVAAVMTPLVPLANWAFYGTQAPPQLWWRLGGVVLVLSAAMTALAILVGRAGPQLTAPPPAGAPPPPVRFLERLPAKLKGGVLYAVEAEDHYLRLHTSKGSDLILFRLSDALVELDGLEGARTHRSWWVSRAAVQSVERGEGRAVLKLPGGVRAPVSRTYLKALREAGWL